MSHRLQVLIPEELQGRVSKAAQRGRMSRGEWVRRAIEEALRRQTAPGTQTLDPLTRLASLQGPTAEIEEMIAQIESGRQ